MGGDVQKDKTGHGKGGANPHNNNQAAGKIPKHQGVELNFQEAGATSHQAGAEGRQQGRSKEEPQDALHHCAQQARLSQGGFWMLVELHPEGSAQQAYYSLCYVMLCYVMSLC